ncbi:unnamed protein product [Rangifer tarandus platyrhynchus]|uniref:Uncharacterized protein n=1 Tax=Rangifer tarandus platyrhynchus TaxID=3082113 RepID=A0AC59ZVF4_RANTA
MPRGPAVGLGHIHGAEITVSRPLSVPRGAPAAAVQSRVLRGDAKGRAAPEGASGLPAPWWGGVGAVPAPAEPELKPRPHFPGREAEPAGSAGPAPDRGDVMRRLPGRLRPPGLPARDRRAPGSVMWFQETQAGGAVSDSPVGISSALWVLEPTRLTLPCPLLAPHA